MYLPSYRLRKEEKKASLVRELYLTIKTKKRACGTSMSYLEYFCWRICRTRHLPK